MMLTGAELCGPGRSSYADCPAAESPIRSSKRGRSWFLKYFTPKTSRVQLFRSRSLLRQLMTAQIRVHDFDLSGLEEAAQPARDGW
jgi:hypothetical protein